MKKNEIGSIAVLSLWVLLFLTVLMFGAGSGVRSRLLTIKKSEMSKTLYNAARSGELYVIYNITTYFKNKQNRDYDILNEAWANSDMYNSFSFGGATCRFPYIYYDNKTGKQNTWYGVIDEERKININHASEDIIFDLLSDNTHLSGDEASFLCKSIIDWRDTDNIFHEGYSIFSEKDYYKNKGYGYCPFNRPFYVLEELFLVDGMDADIFFGILDYITVYGNGAVNINTASEYILKLYLRNESLAAKIVEYRSGFDNLDGTADDRFFQDKKSVFKDLKAFFEISNSEKRQLDRITAQGLIDIRSQNFRADMSVFLQGDNELKAAAVTVFDKLGNIKYRGYRRV